MFYCSSKTCRKPTEKKGYCPECRAAYRKAWAEKHPGYHTEKKREWSKNNPERHKEIEATKYARRKAKEGRKDRVVLTDEERKERKRLAWHKLDVVKRRARRQTLLAIETGKLVRGKCEVCGLPDTEAHHTDYTKPLEVQWLCRKHHLEIHGKTMKTNNLFD